VKSIEGYMPSKKHKRGIAPYGRRTARADIRYDETETVEVPYPSLVLTENMKAWLAGYLDSDAYWYAGRNIREVARYELRDKQTITYVARIDVASASVPFLTVLNEWYPGYLKILNTSRVGGCLVWQQGKCLYLVNDIVNYTLIARDYYTFMQEFFTLFKAKDYAGIETLVKVPVVKKNPLPLSQVYPEGKEELLLHYIAGLCDAKSTVIISGGSPLKNGHKSPLHMYIEFWVPCEGMAEGFIDVLAKYGIESSIAYNRGRSNVRHSRTVVIRKPDSTFRFLALIKDKCVYKRKYFELLHSYHGIFRVSVKEGGLQYKYIADLLREYWACFKHGINPSEVESLFPNMEEISTRRTDVE
jgi:hypothetical protein